MTTAINLSKGQKINLSKQNPSLKRVRIETGWEPPMFAGDVNPDIDSSVAVLNQNKKMEMDLVDGIYGGKVPKDLVFYANPKYTNSSIIHNGDARKGTNDEVEESVDIDLEKIPQDKHFVQGIITIHPEDENGKPVNLKFGEVENVFARLVNADTNEVLYNYNLNLESSTSNAVIAYELIKNNGEWIFGAVGKGTEEGLVGVCKAFGFTV